MPDADLVATVEARSKENPDWMPYFHLQHDDYITLKERCTAHIASGASGDPEGIATIQIGYDTLKLAETLKRGFSTTLAASRISSVSEATRRLPLRMVSRPAFEREVTYDGVKVFLPSKRLADFKKPGAPGQPNSIRVRVHLAVAPRPVAAVVASAKRPRS